LYNLTLLVVVVAYLVNYFLELMLNLLNIFILLLSIIYILFILIILRIKIKLLILVKLIEISSAIESFLELFLILKVDILIS